MVEGEVAGRDGEGTWFGEGGVQGLVPPQTCRILLFEMLCGIPPFRAKSRNHLQELILTGKPKYPKFLSGDALSILKVRD